MTADSSRIGLPLSAVLAVMSGALLAAALAGAALPHAPLRIVVILAAAAVTTLMLRRAPTLLICPLLWLGLASLVFYVLGPVAMMGLISDPPAATDMIRPAIVPAVRAYQAGTGEVLVLQFSTLCLLGVAVLSMAGGRGADPAAPPGARESRAVAAGAAIIIVLCGGLLVLRAYSPGVAAAMTAGAGREILHGLPPLLSVAVAALFYLAAARRLPLVVALGAAIAVAAVLLTTSAAKSAVFISVSGIGLYMAAARLSATRIVVMAGAGVLLLLGAVIALGLIRYPAPPPDFFRNFVVRSIAYKLLARQTETAGCLQTVLASELPDGRGDSPVYFAAAVVPRALWPTKPSLSLGAEYGFRYCAMSVKDISPGSPQSYSITLLGQPVARAGWPGLLVAELVVLFGLGGITILAWRTSSPGPVALAALLPWLMDFDQSFALYVANAAKMAVWMSPAILAMALLAQREKAQP